MNCTLLGKIDIHESIPVIHTYIHGCRRKEEFHLQYSAEGQLVRKKC